MDTKTFTRTLKKSENYNRKGFGLAEDCLLYTSDAADEL